jgi:hypothetical protein
MSMLEKMTEDERDLFGRWLDEDNGLPFFLARAATMARWMAGEGHAREDIEQKVQEQAESMSQAIVPEADQAAFFRIVELAVAEALEE